MKSEALTTAPDLPGQRWLDAGVLARLTAQPLLARFPMVGTVSGQHRSPHRGSSVEFAEYRNYAPGDDVRRLDWRVYGRTDRFYLKEFQAETNLRCYLVVDASGSMGFAARHGSKLDFARRLAATLSYLVIHQGDAAGLVCVGEDRTTEVPPRRNPAHLQNLYRELDRLQPRGPTGLVRALHDLAERVRSRALVIVISDLFADLEPLRDAFQHLRFQHHDVAVFQLLDRLELDFKFEKPIRFADLESPVTIVTETQMIRDRYLELLQAFLNGLRDRCHELKIDYRQVVLDQSYEAVLGGFLVERARAVGAALH